MKTITLHVKIADFHENRKLSFSVSLHVKVSYSKLDKILYVTFSLTMFLKPLQPFRVKT